MKIYHFFFTFIYYKIVMVIHSKNRFKKNVEFLIMRLYFLYISVNF